jgi:hypothetical protein
LFNQIMALSLKRSITMKKNIFIFLLFSFSIHLIAQEDKRGTIRVEKKGQLSKINFDDVNYRLVGIDQYGNVLDSAVVEFQMSATIKGVFYTEKTIGPNLTYKMQQLLGKCDRTSQLFFDKIKAKDRNGTLVEMPKFKYTFGYSNESDN